MTNKGDFMSLLFLFSSLVYADDQLAFDLRFNQNLIKNHNIVFMKQRFEYKLPTEKLGRGYIIYDKKYGELLGCHMLGKNATNLISEISIARKLETTYHEVLKTIHPHPTLSEAINEATADALNEAIHI